MELIDVPLLRSLSPIIFTDYKDRNKQVKSWVRKRRDHFTDTSASANCHLWYDRAARPLTAKNVTEEFSIHPRITCCQPKISSCILLEMRSSFHSASVSPFTSSGPTGI